MDIIIQSTLKTLQKSQVILNSISNTQLCDASVPPYHSSIGTHIRHILDFYDCIFKCSEDGRIDLTARSRNKDVETNCAIALNYWGTIFKSVKSMSINSGKKVWVMDDLGMGKTEIPYTIGALFAQANSHTIHHYAIINYILDNLGIKITDSNFGYNPTTPKQSPVG